MTPSLRPSRNGYSRPSSFGEKAGALPSRESSLLMSVFLCCASSLHRCRAIYGWLSLPFLIFKLPLMFPFLSRSKPTGYAKNVSMLLELDRSFRLLLQKEIITEHRSPISGSVSACQNPVWRPRRGEACGEIRNASAYRQLWCSIPSHDVAAPMGALSFAHFPCRARVPRFPQNH